MEIIIWYLLGVVIGLFGGRYLFKEKPAGFLRIDRSDPDGPLLFLELEQNVEDISQKRTVTLFIKRKDIIPHE